MLVGEFTSLKDLLDNIFDHDQMTNPYRLLNNVCRQIEVDSRSTDIRGEFFGRRLAAAQFHRVELFLQIVGLRQFSVFPVVFGTSLSVQFSSAFRAACLLTIGVPDVGKKPSFADLASSFSRFDFRHRRISIKRYGDKIPYGKNFGTGLKNEAQVDSKEGFRWVRH